MITGEREWELSHASFLTLGFILHMGNLREIRVKALVLHRFLITSLPPRDFDGGADSAEQIAQLPGKQTRKG